MQLVSLCTWTSFACAANYEVKFNQQKPFVRHTHRERERVKLNKKSTVYFHVRFNLTLTIKAAKGKARETSRRQKFAQVVGLFTASGSLLSDDFLPARAIHFTSECCFEQNERACFEQTSASGSRKRDKANEKERERKMRLQRNELAKSCFTWLLQPFYLIDADDWKKKQKRTKACVLLSLFPGTTQRNKMDL